MSLFSGSVSVYLTTVLSMLRGAVKNWVKYTSNVIMLHCNCSKSCNNKWLRTVHCQQFCSSESLGLDYIEAFFGTISGYRWL